MAVSDPIRLACHCGVRLVLPRLQRWYTCAACGRRWRATVGVETKAPTPPTRDGEPD